MILRVLLLGGSLTLTLGNAWADDKELTIRNQHLEANYDRAADRWTLIDLSHHRAFLQDARVNGGVQSARIRNVTDRRFGRGRAIEVSRPDGNRDTVSLFPRLPFALFRSSLSNGSATATVTQKVRTLSAKVDLASPASSLRTLGTGGLLAPDKNPGSYMWLAIAEPETRQGVVLGWLTADRGSGVLFSRVDGDSVRAEAQIDYGRLLLTPGATEDLETLAVGYFDDARLGLEQWAAAVAKTHDIHLPPQPAGYCTWYSDPYGGASDEKHLPEQAAFAARHLAPFGFSVVQIDDQWQAGVSTNGPNRNFTTNRANGPYPDGMKAAADNIKSLGLVPGLWFMPFAGTYYDPYFKDHQDWFVRRLDGRPYETDWGGTCLDMTHPGAREHLREVVRRIGRDWGYQYFKMDGLWTGTGTRQQYVNSGYQDDGIGDAVFNDPNKSNLEAYRDGLRLVRETVGRKVFLLGCCSPQNMRSYGGAFGLVDAMRIGPDNGSDWKSLLNGPTFGSRQYFLHGRVWYNDPDPVYVRNKIPLSHAQLICSWVALSGQLNLNSEWLPGLAPERLDLLKRTLPNHGLLPRPADLFEREIPSVWLLRDDRRQPVRQVVGLFNWQSAEQSFDVSLERLGLDPVKDYLAFDYWQNALLPVIRGRLQLSAPAESCRIVAVLPQAAPARPQLLSTSRHITQGIVDVLQERWDQKAAALRGVSRVVEGDPYELRIASGVPATSVSVSAEDQAAGVRATARQTGELTRVLIDSPSSREVSWTVKFK
jgi:hypothetical protein